MANKVNGLENQMLEAEIQAEIVAEILVEIKTEVEKEIKGKPILGFTDKETVKLDFDDKSFKTAKYWAFRADKRFRLDGFVILKSSEKHYHIVFDREVSWEKNLSIVGWVAVCSRSEELL